MKDIIETRQLKKIYGNVKAVDDISIRVGKGEIYGFLGLNGAGKTTTIRMLLGMVRPTMGECRLFGEAVHPGKTGLWKKVGYLVEIPYSYPDLTVKENLEIIRKLRMIGDKSCVANVMERLHLIPYAGRKAKNLSLGNAQRLGIAKAILHDPEILILDEPANGLDPAGIVEVREMLQDLASEKGVTVFISSHILGEISKFATRIGIIHDGKLIQEMDIPRIDELRNRWLTVNTTDNHAALSLLQSKGYPGETDDFGRIILKTPAAIKEPGKINLLLVQAGHVPALLKVEEENLEAYFLRIIGRKGGEW